MKVVVIQNHNGYAGASIIDEEDVTASWLTQNFLTVLGVFATENEAAKALIEDGWECEQSSGDWIYFSEE